MLSMINPDSMTRFDSQQKFSTHEGGFYDHHHHHESPEKKSGKHSTLNFPAQKTMANFYFILSLSKYLSMEPNKSKPE
jgi:hypothetical protein